MERTVTLEDIQDLSLSDLLRDVAHGQDTLHVLLDNGREVVLHSPPPAEQQESLTLKPLPQFPGFVPPGWKDAIYGDHGEG